MYLKLIDWCRGVELLELVQSFVTNAHDEYNKLQADQGERTAVYVHIHLYAKQNQPFAIVYRDSTGVSSDTLQTIRELALLEWKGIYSMLTGHIPPERDSAKSIVKANRN